MGDSHTLVQNLARGPILPGPSALHQSRHLPFRCLPSPFSDTSMTGAP